MPTSDNLTPRPFRGFRSPSYTQVPDELFDELLVELSGGELKVLLYIIRRTFGFKRESDNISLSQMLNGIRTQDGRVLDRGVGLSKKTLLLALRSLRERGVILAEWRQSADKGNEPTSYCLNVVGADDVTGGPGNGSEQGGAGRLGEHVSESSQGGFDEGKSPPPLGEKLHQGGGGETTPPLGEKLHQGVGGKTTPSPRGKNYTTQETVIQETVKGETAPGSTRFDGSRLHINTEVTVTPGLSGVPIYVQSVWERPPADDLSPRPSRSARGPDPASLDRRVHHAPGPPRDRGQPQPQAPSAQPLPGTPAAARAAPGRQPRTPPQIAAQIEQVSDEFHDEDHVRPNIGQAVRLWQASGLDAAVFADRLLEARSITKRQVVHKPASGESGQFGLRNKMPYFFSVLRDLLGLQDA